MLIFGHIIRMIITNQFKLNIFRSLLASSVLCCLFFWRRTTSLFPQTVNYRMISIPSISFHLSIRYYNIGSITELNDRVNGQWIMGFNALELMAQHMKSVIKSYLQLFQRLFQRKKVSKWFAYARVCLELTSFTYVRSHTSTIYSSYSGL